MHGMFTFGVPKWFTFSFSLQLGEPYPSPLQGEQSRQRESGAHVTSTETIHVTEHLHPSVTEPDTSVVHRQHENPTQPSFRSLQSIIDAQPHVQRTARDYGNGNPVVFVVDAGPVLREPSGTKHPKPTIDTPTALPRTPKSVIPTAQHNVHRTRRQAHFSDAYGVPRQSKPVPQPRLKMPTKEPSSNLLPPPSISDAPSTPCSKPLSFQTLPLEIRHMIYHEILVSAAPIRKPHKLVCNKRSIMLDKNQPVKDIDSSILRVCRMVYFEAVPVLYGKNTFEFSKPRKLRDFSHAGLDRSHTSKHIHLKRRPLALILFLLLAAFAFHDAPAGRFTLVRSIVLRLGHDRKPYVWQQPGAQPAPDRKRIWGHWYQYFFNDSDPHSIFDWGMFPSSTNGFPALDRLVLDFTDWKLSESDAIRVDPFVKKLTQSSKLSVVVIKGVKNTLSLEGFRKGLLKPGGVFVVKE
ncbi:MAG: hypothetical protein Q9168_001353 [Polycauliona sp. 1 TL-2023]